jgi:hypothetical protein
MRARMFGLVARAVLLAGILQPGALSAQTTSPYQHVLSSGPFALPASAVSVGWKVLNDSPDSQTVRVTVYQVRIGTAKTPMSPPGPITRTLQPYVASTTRTASG